MNQDYAATTQLDERELFSKVFGWMALALGITALVSMITIQSGLVNSIMGNPIIFY
jgi:FtsH-binding integral membrane protein